MSQEDFPDPPEMPEGLVAPHPSEVELGQDDTPAPAPISVHEVISKLMEAITGGDGSSQIEAVRVYTRTHALLLSEEAMMEGRDRAQALSSLMVLEDGCADIYSEVRGLYEETPEKLVPLVLSLVDVINFIVTSVHQSFEHHGYKDDKATLWASLMAMLAQARRWVETGECDCGHCQPLSEEERKDPFVEAFKRAMEEGTPDA